MPPVEPFSIRVEHHFTLFGEFACRNLGQLNAILPRSLQSIAYANRRRECNKRRSRQSSKTPWTRLLFFSNAQMEPLHVFEGYRYNLTGGKQNLLGKRGNRYLRKLFVQCARAVLQQKTKQTPGLSAWLEKLTARTHRHVAGVAVANKLARMAWAVLATGEAYRAHSDRYLSSTSTKEL